MPQARYQQPRELSETEFNTIADALIAQAPAGLSEQEFDRWLNPRLEQAIGEAENTAAPVEGSAISRFASGAWEVLNPVEMVKGVASAVRHPIQTIGNLAEAQIDQFRQAGAAAREGTLAGGIEAIGRTGAGLLPILGPLAAGAGEKLGQGDVAGAAGTTAGLLAPMGVAPAVRAARGMAPTRTAQQLEGGAASRVVDVMAPKVGANKMRFGRMAEDVAPAIARDPSMAAWSREGLAEKVGAKLAEAETALDVAADARLAARTFPTQPIIADLLRKRSELTAEAVTASKIKPREIPPDPAAVQAAGAAERAILQGEQQFFLKWLADDLREVPFQEGTVQSIHDLKTFSREAGDRGGNVFVPRVPGTPTQAMLHAVGIPGTRAQIAATLEALATGKGRVSATTRAKLETLADVMRQSWDGKRFDFNNLPEETLAAMKAVGLKQRDLKSPMTPPNFLETPDAGIAARYFPDQVDATPTPDVFPPGVTKKARRFGQSVVPGPNAPRVAMIDQAIAEIRALGPAARYEPLRRIRQSYDGPAKAVYNPSMTQDFLKAQGGKFGAADVTGTLREALAKMDPPTAAANAEYSLWRKANDVLEATAEVERTRPKVGRMMASRIAATLFGLQAAGPAGGAAGLLGGPLIEALLSSAPTTKLQSARLMTQLATAIRRGDVGRVQSLTTQLQSLAKRYSAVAAAAAGRSSTGPEAVPALSGLR